MEERLIPRSEASIDVDAIKHLTVFKDFAPPATFDSQQLSVVAKSSLDIIDSIKNTDLLTEEDARNIEKAKTFLVTSYKDVPMYNTKISKVASILSDGKFATSDAKYWQCKMQAEVHFNEFVRGIYKVDRVKIDIDEIHYQLKVIDGLLSTTEAHNLDKIKLSFDRRRLVNKLEQYNYEMKLLEKDLKQRLREISEWADLATELEKGCKHNLTNYEEHTYANQLLALKNTYEKANNPQEKAIAADHLNTLLKLLGKEPVK